MKCPLNFNARYYVLGLAATMLCLPGKPLSAETLRWKFKEGETLRYEVVETRVSGFKAAGKALESTVVQEFDTAWTVGKLRPDGTAVLTQTIERLRTKLESDLLHFDYDTKVEKTVNGPIERQMVALMKLLVDQRIVCTISPEGLISDLKLPPGFLETLKQAGSTTDTTGLYSEEGLKNLFNEITIDLPKDDLAENKSWTRTSSTEVEPFGTLKSEKTFTDLGEKDASERIDLKVKVSLVPSTSTNFEIKLGNQKGSGTYAFDKGAGHLVRSEVVSSIETIVSVAGQPIVQTKDAKLSVSLKNVTGPK